LPPRLKHVRAGASSSRHLAEKTADCPNSAQRREESPAVDAIERVISVFRERASTQARPAHTMVTPRLERDTETMIGP
jgi:hypothetical protein